MRSLPWKQSLVVGWLRRFGWCGLLLVGYSAHGQQLTWGTGGAGGSGTWDGTTANWWNGTTNVPWSTGTAIFAGTGGTVTSLFPGQTASGLTFNSPGYTLTGGWINFSGSTFTVTTNADATISTTLSDSVSGGSTLVKNGTGVLTVSGTNFAERVQVNTGEFRVAGTSSLFFSDVTLANTAGVTVTLATSLNTANIHSLSGGGTSGGVLQPDTTARTVTAMLWSAGTFRGVAQDNGAGKLALSVFTQNQTVTLAGANTYSGATTVTVGTLAFSENGSALNSTVSVSSLGTLLLDNTTTAVANRLSDTAAVTLQGGKLQFIGNASTAVEEQLGTLNFAGNTTITNTQSGSTAALLTFSGVNRQSFATLSLAGTGRTKWTGMANSATGIIGAYATYGNEWATVSSDGRAEAFAGYTGSFSGATAHTKLTTASITLPATSTAATFNWQNSTGTSGVMNIGAGRTLTLAEGGLLSSGTNTNEIDNGTLRSGNTELVITNQNALTIASSISETAAGTALTKTGVGVLTLTGSNTYSGQTTINQGTVVVSADANLGTGSTIVLNGATLRAAQSFNSTKGFGPKTVDLVGTIDTAGHDISFSGANAGALQKTGAGTLTLSNTATGNVTVNQGTVVLPNATSGNLTLAVGTLRASGTLDSLSLQNTAGSVLDIGGPGAATLTTNNLLLAGASFQLTIDFGVGANAAGSDLWNIGSGFNSFSLAANSFLFDFQNLGGATAGKDYTLINFNSGSVNASSFGIAPDAVAAGWSGTFTTTANSVQVHLTSVPEPGAGALLAMGAFLGFVWRRRMK